MQRIQGSIFRNWNVCLIHSSWLLYIYIFLLLYCNHYDSRYNNSKYRHPIIQRKYALSAYYIWLEKYNELSDIRPIDFDMDQLPSSYQTLESKAASLLEKMHLILPTDNELTLTYLRFLKYTQNDKQMELVARRSLKACLLEENTLLIMYAVSNRQWWPVLTLLF